MFKRLRQKVENVDTNQTNSFPGSKRVDDNRFSSRSTNLKKTDSLSSLNSFDDTQSIDTISKEDLHSMLLSKTTQVKRLEVKLAEYHQSLKERTKECEKLSSALEKQQDNALRKINQLNETYDQSKKSSDAIISRLEESESKLTIAFDKLKEENSELHHRIDEWEREKKEFNLQKEEFYEKRDNSEELQDLQKQESAKLKHMLMNSEKEQKKLQEELDQNVASLIESREHNDRLEVELHEANRDHESTKQTLEELLSDKKKLLDDLNESEATQSRLHSESCDYKDKLSCLAVDLQKSRSNLSNVEVAHNKLVDKYETLKHNSEAALDKAQSDLEERESLISHLKNKLLILEQRSSAEKLPQDEQVQALLSERASLEQKVEESHQQLINIKSTWSDKINKLEAQVAHLNSKIAEDCEEISQKSLEMEEAKKDFRKKIDSLESKLSVLEEDNRDLLSHNENILQQIAEAEAKLIEEKTVSDMELSKMKKMLADIEEESRSNEKDLRRKIEEICEKLRLSNEALKNSENKYKSLLEAEELKVKDLRHQAAALQGVLDTKNVELISREKINNEMVISLEEVREARDHSKALLEEMERKLSSSQESVEEASARIICLTEELESFKKQLHHAEEEVRTVSAELERSRKEVDEKQQGLAASRGMSDEKKAESERLAVKISELESQLDTRTAELISCKEEVASLKNCHTEENEELKRIREEKLRLEDRILEKDRSLKLQQQRMSDMKKTLQKEMNKKLPGNSKSSVNKPAQKMPDREGAPQNGGEAEVNPIPSLLAGDMSLDDPSLSDGQRDVVVKYLKHVVLTFLSCGQAEAQQLIRAISAILKFTRDEEKLVKEVFEYRTSWFASRPNTKNVIKPSLKGKGRHGR